MVTRLFAIASLVVAGCMRGDDAQQPTSSCPAVAAAFSVMLPSDITSQSLATSVSGECNPKLYPIHMPDRRIGCQTASDCLFMLNFQMGQMGGLPAECEGGIEAKAVTVPVN